MGGEAAEKEKEEEELEKIKQVRGGGGGMQYTSWLEKMKKAAEDQEAERARREEEERVRREEAAVEEAVVEMIRRGDNEGLKTNSGQFVAFGNHFITVYFDPPMWSWNGFLFLYHPLEGYNHHFFCGFCDDDHISYSDGDDDDDDTAVD